MRTKGCWIGRAAASAQVYVLTPTNGLRSRRARAFRDHDGISLGLWAEIEPPPSWCASDDESLGFLRATSGRPRCLFWIGTNVSNILPAATPPRRVWGGYEPQRSGAG